MLINRDGHEVIRCPGAPVESVQDTETGEMFFCACVLVPDNSELPRGEDSVRAEASNIAPRRCHGPAKEVWIEQ